MDTNDLKQLIGSECLVIDPRSKKQVYEPATIISASFTASRLNKTEIFEHISFRVVLHKVTVRKGNHWREKREYHRSFDVSRDRVHLCDS